jgi:hypothetical protein
MIFLTCGAWFVFISSVILRQQKIYSLGSQIFDV